MARGKYLDRWAGGPAQVGTDRTSRFVASISVSRACIKLLHNSGPQGPPVATPPSPPAARPQMGHARRRGHRHAHHRHRCPHRSTLPVTALSLLFLTVFLLSVSLLSAPPLEDRHGITSSFSSRRSLRLPTVWSYFSLSAPWRVRAA
jgi:hypothetical protein